MVTAEEETVEIQGMIALTRARREGLTIGTTGNETVIGMRTGIATTATEIVTGKETGTGLIETETQTGVETTTGTDPERGRGTGRGDMMIVTDADPMIMRSVGG